MSEWKAKRFWTDVTVDEVDGGAQVLLDGRPVRTPAKAPLIVPTRAFAEMIAAEWEAQVEGIDPTSMPATRTANAAIDKVRVQRAEVAAMLAEYGGSDLLCYRAERPDALVLRQAERWDPLLEWARDALGVRLKTAVGVMPVAQDPAAVDVLTNRVSALDPFSLSAFHDLVSLSGSLILALAVADRRLTGAEAWALSRLDEDFQIEQWGADEEAAEHSAIKRTAFLDAERFFHALAHV